MLKIKHGIVCGHYGCGGIKAALLDERHGIVDHWLAPVRETYRQHREEIDAIKSLTERIDKLCELNVKDRVMDVASMTIVRDAWSRGQPLAIHGWVYGLKDGLVRNLDVSIDGPADAG